MWMQELTWEQVQEKRDAIPRAIPLFDRDEQVTAVTDFLADVMNRS